MKAGYERHQGKQSGCDEGISRTTTRSALAANKPPGWKGGSWYQTVKS